MIFVLTIVKKAILHKETIDKNTTNKKDYFCLYLFISLSRCHRVSQHFQNEWLISILINNLFGTKDERYKDNFDTSRYVLERPEVKVNLWTSLQKKFKENSWYSHI